MPVRTITRYIIACCLLALTITSHAQSIKLSTLEEDRIDDYSHDTIARSYWHVLSRGTVADPVTVSFRVRRKNGDYTLDIKLMDADVKTIVARNAPMKLYLEDGELQTVYNTAYQTVCRGCGATGYDGNDAPGMMLTYPLTNADVAALRRSCITRIHIHEAHSYLDKKISLRNSELFITYLDMVGNTNK